MDKDKLKHTFDMIVAGLSKFRNPAIMCSFGKDSLVVLHLVHSVKRIPVIHHRESVQPAKYVYANRLIESLNLEVHDFPVIETKVCEKGDEFDIVNCYPFGKNHLALPRGTRHPKEGSPVVCGLEVYGKPTGTYSYPWDFVFHGHKSCDSDPVQGDVPLASDYAMNVDAPTIGFPLRHWTDEDVWEYIEENGLPIDHNCYEKVDGRWTSKKDKTLNPDYIEACTACMRSNNPQVVVCPKLNATVSNVSSRLRQFTLPKLSYLAKE